MGRASSISRPASHNELKCITCRKDCDNVEKFYTSCGLVQCAGCQNIDSRRNLKRICPVPDLITRNKKHDTQHTPIKEDTTTSNPTSQEDQNEMQCFREKEEGLNEEKEDSTTSNLRPIASLHSREERGPMPFIAWNEGASNTGDPFALNSASTNSASTVVASLVDDLVYGCDSDDIIALTRMASTRDELRA